MVTSDSCKFIHTHLYKSIVYQLGPSFWLYSCLSGNSGFSGLVFLCFFFKGSVCVCGRNGMRAVHLAHKMATEKPVTIKLLQKGRRF